MKQKLWELQARPGRLLLDPKPEQVKKIFYREFFHRIKGRLKPLKMTDTTGFVVNATSNSFDHIFFKEGVFQVERAKRVYWIKETILNSCYLFEDKQDRRRYHYLQPYRVNERLESFCVITERGKDVSKIVTAFPLEWSRVEAILRQK